MKAIILMMSLVLQHTFGQRYVDLGHNVDDQALVWPLGHPDMINFTLTVVEEGFDTPVGPGWKSGKKFCGPEHVSTHLDAPYHFVVDGWTIEQIPVERLVAEAILIDMTEKVEENPDSMLMVEDLLKWVDEYGPIPNKSVILLRTDWSKKYGNPRAYFGYEDDVSVKIFPGFSKEVANYIVDLKENGTIVYGVGLDGPSIDKGHVKNVPAHRAFFEANLYGIEDLTNLAVLPPRGFQVMIMPMKITNATAAPCRVIAKILN